MQTIVGIRHFEAPRFATLRDLLRHCARQYGDLPAYRYHDGPGGPERVRSFNEYVTDIDCFGTGLLNLGLKGCHIGIVGRNAYPWAVAHNAIVNGTGVSVPLDRQLPQPEVIHLCARGEMEALVYHEQHQEIVEAVAGANSKIRFFICMQPGAVTQALQQTDPRFISFDAVLERGRQRLAEGDRSFVDAPIDPEAMSSLLFTSGTGVMPKAVMLCHRNITHNIYAVMGTLDVRPGQNALSVLPLHHTFENTVGMYMIQAYGCCICFSDGLRRFSENLQEWKINILLAVPIVFETAYRQIQKKLEKTGRLAAVNALRKIAAALRWLGIDRRRRMFRPILAGLGGELKLCVCGAAAIDREIVRFYNDIGIDFFCGYGLTETAPVISVCSTFANPYGTVGQPVAGIEVAIDTPETKRGATGEILTRSDSVMLGYYRSPEATAAVMSADGWFRTGDLGCLDRQGCITITGRIKSMIVLNNGKKAFPEEIEALLSRIDSVREAFVWGETSSRGAVEICAKLVVDLRRLPGSVGEQPEAVHRHLAAQVDLVNRQMPSYKEIKHIVLSRQDVIKTDGTTVRRSAEQERLQRLMKGRGLDVKTAQGHWLDEPENT